MIEESITFNNDLQLNQNAYTPSFLYLKYYIRNVLSKQSMFIDYFSKWKLDAYFIFRHIWLRKTKHKINSINQINSPLLPPQKSIFVFNTFQENTNFNITSLYQPP